MSKKNSTSAQPKAAPTEALPTYEQLAVEFYTQAVHVKYNLYLLSQATIFAALAPKFDSVEEAVSATVKVLSLIDAANHEKK